MSDPAEDAVRRSRHYRAEHSWEDKVSGLAAAREALKPIRELYEEQPGDADESAELWVFLNKLAHLIFSTEELER
ncbi:hypothetical protein [Mycobacteroides chelonae]|uniref:hypothetical protein n=1 Tax=Mycobacteroides chelonae TaxID=1774 RepID=UPI000B18A0FD|nr:hypothetical protein [Mycobacteroides chelonae]